MIDRVQYPGGDGGRVQADLIGFAGVEGTVHAVLRLDNGRYRSISVLQIERVKLRGGELIETDPLNPTIPLAAA